MCRLQLGAIQIHEVLLVTGNINDRLIADVVDEQRDLLAAAESTSNIDAWLQDIPGIPRQQAVLAQQYSTIRAHV